jgi:hypothetical protein
MFVWSLWGLVPGVAIAVYAFIQGANPFVVVAIVLFAMSSAAAQGLWDLRRDRGRARFNDGSKNDGP